MWLQSVCLTGFTYWWSLPHHRHRKQLACPAVMVIKRVVKSIYSPKTRGWSLFGPRRRTPCVEKERFETLISFHRQALGGERGFNSYATTTGPFVRTGTHIAAKRAKKPQFLVDRRAGNKLGFRGGISNGERAFGLRLPVHRISLGHLLYRGVRIRRVSRGIKVEVVCSGFSLFLPLSVLLPTWVR